MLSGNYIITTDAEQNRNLASVKNVLDYIDTHYREPLSVKELATLSNYSEYYFMKLFKQYTGKSVMAFVRDKRMELAKEEFDENRICDVAERFGYESTSGFSRAYKRCYGECPCGSRMNA